MTKHLHKLAHDLQARLLSGGGPDRHMHPVLRDGWASLYRWHESGERVWRIEDAKPPELADDLPLATANIYAPGVAYQMPDRAAWIVVARHTVEEPIQVSPDQSYAFPEAMLTYVTQVDTGIAAGCINLEEAPTWRDLYLAPGNSGARALTQDDIAVEETRFLLALRYLYRPPAIVI